MSNDQQTRALGIADFLESGANLAAAELRVAEFKRDFFTKAQRLCLMNGPEAAVASMEKDLETLRRRGTDAQAAEEAMAYGQVITALKRRMQPRKS